MVQQTDSADMNGACFIIHLSCLKSVISLSVKFSSFLG